MTTQGRFLTADPKRKPLLGKLHLAKKQLGLDDATYRAILARHGYAWYVWERGHPPGPVLGRLHKGS